VRNGDAYLGAELVRLGALAFANARDFRCVQSEDFVTAFVTALLLPHACYQGQQRLQLRHCI
jgi:hypothetical protein